MREILFRGKRVDNGECIEGFYYKELSVSYIIKDLRPKGEGWRTDCIEVIPETIGQYTGLIDKNGVKIFEGDIVKHFSNLGLDGELFSEVKWGKNSHGWSLNTGCGRYYKLPSKKLIEVIGNIHDNPELLK